VISGFLKKAFLNIGYLFFIKNLKCLRYMRLTEFLNHRRLAPRWEANFHSSIAERKIKLKRFFEIGGRCFKTF